MYWAKEIALEIIEKWPNKEVYTLASGISPSGFIHIGNFREIATPYLVALELKKLGKKVRYILSWDEFDRFRKTPGNIDQTFNKYIGCPYVDIPSPFNENESYAKTFEDIFTNELNKMGITDIEFIFQAKEYRSSRYLKDIKYCMEKRKEIFDIIASFKTQNFSENDRNSYYPISLYCSKCKKDLTKILFYDDFTGDLEYMCECGNKETVNINSYTNLKLVWKVDWPMRWKQESVDFECGGRDHSTEGGSFQVASKIAKEIFGIDAPHYAMYDFIGIKGGEMKMSSSKGNTITLTDLLRVYDKNIIMWFYAKCKSSQAFDIAFDNDVIRYYQEFDRWVKNYFQGNIDEKNKAAIENTQVTNEYQNYPNFSYLATFLPMVSYDKKIISSLLEKDIKKHKELLKNKEIYRKELGVDDKFTLVSVGRPIKLKGFDVLLNSYIKTSLTDKINLYIVGGKPQDEIQKIVNDNKLSNVHFIGLLNSEELNKYYAMADAFILCTKTDVWGLVIEEAMSFGLPVITSDNCGAGVHFNMLGDNVMICGIEDEDAYSKCITKLYKDDKLCKKLGKKSLDVVKEYIIENSAKDIIKALNEI